MKLLPETCVDACIGNFFQREFKSALHYALDYLLDVGFGWSVRARAGSWTWCVFSFIPFSETDFVVFFGAIVLTFFAAVSDLFWSSLRAPPAKFSLEFLLQGSECCFGALSNKEDKKKGATGLHHYFAAFGNMKLELSFDLSLVINQMIFRNRYNFVQSKKE